MVATKGNNNSRYEHMFSKAVGGHFLCSSSTVNFFLDGFILNLVPREKNPQNNQKFQSITGDVKLFNQASEAEFREISKFSF